MRQLAKADVISWDDHQIKIRCPFCDNVHLHHRASRRYPRQVNVSHCDSLCARHHNGKYQLVYPFDVHTGKAVYEIDKLKKQFITVGIKADEDLDVDELVSSIEGRLNVPDERRGIPSLDDGTEEEEVSHKTESGEVITWTEKKLDRAITNCLFGNTAAVQEFLKESSDTPTLIRGEDAAGKSALIMASAEMHPKMVNLLLDHGSEVNRSDIKGRTPLMEAALWGRAQNVDVLLQRGAEKTLRDKHGRQAIDFAKQNDRNSK
ncbi:hypothetical protein ACJ73_04286 [Blastomyces percursus]|uniref:Uncharacterized protein n=1 Tax=Blastomyces percursus TaxID=1658174 RepID=A0A1J9R777_9EURO|nr:hypothetical protein ACJ73_04286 [Blastomyces percursus]